jgi:LuxR family maltose regulon positive regulatory protein
MGVQPGAVQTAELEQSTEGWAVGLQLAGLALARQSSDWRLPVGREYIFDYLAKEVLQREPANVQDFLTKTALPDRFCLGLCQAILAVEQGGAQPEDAPALLAYLERANLFLVPLDSSGTWFRYHALFGEFLRRQLASQQVEPLYRAASLWFEGNGLLDDAIHHAIHASDFDRAASLIEKHYRDLLQRGEQAALSDWLNALPAAMFEQRPRLWLAKGWVSVIAIDSTQAEACAQKAQAAVSASQADESLRAEAKSLAILARIFVGQVVPAGEIYATSAELAEQDDFLHHLLYFNLGVHYVLLGQTALAVEALNQTLRLSQSINNPLVTIIAQVQLGETRQLRGALGLAERAFQQAIHYAKDVLGEQTFLLGMPYVSYAELLREQNRFEEAIQYAELGIAYCQVWQPVASMDGLVALARLRAAQGRWDEAFAHIERAFQATEASVSTLDDTLVAMNKVRLALLRGDLPRAARWIEMYDFEKSSAGMYHLLAELAQLVLLRARVMEFEGGSEPAASASAADALAALIAEAESGERVSRVIEALILRAYALHAAARHADAAESLSRALALGAQGGYVRIFADEGSRLLRLLEHYHSQIHAPQSYFQDILALLRSEATRLAQAAPPDQLFAEGLTPLTRRELDILELMAAGKSNQEIASECVLALNTVKKHVANILSKMGVANRTQAVMLARKLGWLK